MVMEGAKKTIPVEAGALVYLNNHTHPFADKDRPLIVVVVLKNIVLARGAKAGDQTLVLRKEDVTQSSMSPRVDLSKYLGPTYNEGLIGIFQNQAGRIFSTYQELLQAVIPPLNKYLGFIIPSERDPWHEIKGYREDALPHLSEAYRDLIELAEENGWLHTASGVYIISDAPLSLH